MAGAGASDLTDACVSDEAVCSQDEECCSGVCEDGSCRTLNSSCRTSGNPCESHEQCCSLLCAEGVCSRQSSFCVQEGDICFSGAECCSQSCEVSADASVGVCGAAPKGPSNCSAGMAGSLCDSCNDCCSRLCVPFGRYGQSVCAQAKGCRQTGELCSDDLDCCGGDPDASLPGAGNVVCTKGSGESWGICRNALSCSPQGNVCHIQNYACGVSAASNKCCGQDENEGVCRLDGDGIPRCTGLGSSCQVLGDSCAMSEDCCEGLCLPSDTGALICQLSGSCLPLEARCTATSECCPEAKCVPNALAAFGTCLKVEP